MHVAADINTHTIIVAELSSSNVTNSAMLPNLCQIYRKINVISGNRVYETRQCYETVRIK
ncbi:hypothetical protein [Candidatus Enterovibrio altilux]|uniref:hypothetical protein n=1 Tax=Candidatus Enterovibrio altilux TaxID=1927128 RepID=UPI00123810BE|nr:hypothetical protein [Candidatus Enterovibrio luxaltus]